MAEVNTLTNLFSATDFITDALTDIGAIAPGDPLEAPELASAQRSLNQLLDSLSADRSSIFTIAEITTDANNNTLLFTPGIGRYQLGAGVNNPGFNLPRPPRIDGWSIIINSSSSNPIELPMMRFLNWAEWQRVTNKLTPSPYPLSAYDDGAFPFRNLAFWPVPSQSNPLKLYAWQALQTFADLTSQFSFPPGYAEKLRYSLAKRLMVSFPGDATRFPIIQNLLAEAENRITVFNDPVVEASADPGLDAESEGWYNFYSDSAANRGTS